MSLVLRHQPGYIGISLNQNGWADMKELIDKMNTKGIQVDLQVIETIVATNDKKRFAFNENKTMIRASQGHSVQVDIELKEIAPPDILFHGTAIDNISSIMRNGLQKQSRQYVHLSDNADTAKVVGSRHGKPVILSVDTKSMHKEGFIFYQSANFVWLTDRVPAEFISILQ